MQVLGLSPTVTKASSGHTDPGSLSATPNRASSVYVDPSRSSVIPFQVLLQVGQSQQLPNLTGPPLNRWFQAGRAAPSSPRPPLTIQPLDMSLWRPAPQLAGVGKGTPKQLLEQIPARGAHIKVGMTQQVQTSKTYWEVLEAYWGGVVGCSLQCLIFSPLFYFLTFIHFFSCSGFVLFGC